MIFYSALLGCFIFFLVYDKKLVKNRLIGGIRSLPYSMDQQNVDFLFQFTTSKKEGWRFAFQKINTLLSMLFLSKNFSWRALQQVWLSGLTCFFWCFAQSSTKNIHTETTWSFIVRHKCLNCFITGKIIG